GLHWKGKFGVRLAGRTDEYTGPSRLDWSAPSCPPPKRILLPGAIGDWTSAQWRRRTRRSASSRLRWRRGCEGRLAGWLAVLVYGSHPGRLPAGDAGGQRAEGWS